MEQENTKPNTHNHNTERERERKKQYEIPQPELKEECKNYHTEKIRRL